jgi:hypothetical protein
MERNKTFEGELVYSVNYQITKPEAQSLIPYQLLNRPDTLNIKIRHNNYKISFNGNRVNDYIIFKGETNKRYHFTGAGQMQLCTISDMQDDEQFRRSGSGPMVITTDSLYQVGNYNCHKVSVIWDDVIFTYYYQPDLLTADKLMFLNHYTDGLSAFYKLSGSHPIKIEMFSQGRFKIVQTLTAIKERKVHRHNFEIPELLPADELYPNPAAGKTIYKVKRN